MTQTFRLYHVMCCRSHLIHHTDLGNTIGWIFGLCILFLSNYNKTPQKLKVYTSVFQRVSFCLGAEKLHALCFQDLITLHILRSVLHSLPYSFRKGSEAARSVGEPR